MSFYFDFKIGSDHMVGCDIIADGRICHDGPCGGPLCSADYINSESVIIEIFYKFHHRKVEIVNVAHVVKTCCLLLSEFNYIVSEFFYCHTCVSLGKVSGKGLVRDIAGLNGGGDLF